MSGLHLKDVPTLADIQQYVRDASVVRNFDHEDVTQKFMMLFEEVGELAKAARTHTGVRVAADSRDQDVAGEAADVLFLLVNICNKLGIDLEAAFRAKEEKNKQRVWK